MAEVPLAAALPGGTTFHGRYRIVRCINAGGMGAVYDCVHVKTGKHRALKVMLPQVLAHAGMRERFELEARATADIESDHIVETFDAGIDEESGAPFLVMELLRGKDLDVVLREGGPLTPEEVVVLLAQAALALDKTHAASIVHRDLKPQNLFVTTRDDGSPCLKVLDFGIAKVVAESDKTKAQTATIGTPVYMSPEQILGQGTLGPRADLYALGHIAFTLLVGQPYWEEDWREAGSPFVLWSKVMAGAKEPPSHRAYRLGAALPVAFDAWFATATAHHAVARFDLATTMIAALAEALGVALDRVSPKTLATLAAKAFVPVERASRVDITVPASLRRTRRYAAPGDHAATTGHSAAVFGAAERRGQREPGGASHGTCRVAGRVHAVHAVPRARQVPRAPLCWRASARGRPRRRRIVGRARRTQAAGPDASGTQRGRGLIDVGARDHRRHDRLPRATATTSRRAGPGAERRSRSSLPSIHASPSPERALLAISLAPQEDGSRSPATAGPNTSAREAELQPALSDRRERHPYAQAGVPMTKRLGAPVALAVVLSLVRSARADTVDECDAAYKQTQISRRAGKLIDARRQALICAAPACPDADKTDCTTWLAEIDASAPSVVFVAKDRAGLDVVKVRVSIDGQVVAEALDGKALTLDPGARHVRFELAGAPPVEQDIVVQQGEKNRRVLASFATGVTPGAPAGPAQSVEATTVAPAPGVPNWAWGVGGAGLAAAIAGGVALGVGVLDNNKIASGQTNSADANSDHNATAAALWSGGILLTVGAAGIIGGIVGIATAPKAPTAAQIRWAPMASKSGYGIGLSGEF